MAFALLCLFFSAVWHTMSGCADPTSMEFCARIDYVGIGWYVPSPLFQNTKCSCHPIRRLISASIGTIVYYGFQHCYPRVGHAFLCLCFLTGLAGNIFPFMAWFNQHKYRVSVSLCISPTHGLKANPMADVPHRLLCLDGVLRHRPHGRFRYASFTKRDV